MQNDSIDNLRLDLDKSSIRKAIYVRVGDTRARTVHITLVSNGKVVDLTNAVICEVLINKPDGSMNDQAMVQYGNELQYTFRTMDINVPGECTCQVMVTFDDGAVVTSPDFSVMVYEKEVDQQYETSLNEYTAITQQLVDVTQLANQAATDAERAETARENIEDVEARVIVYEGNVEAFTDRAEAAAIAAEASNQSAGDSAEAASEYCATTMGYRDEVANDKQEVDDKANEILGYDYQAQAAAEAAEAAQLAAETAQGLAEDAQESAEASADTATTEATKSRSYARGDTETRTGEITDNAKYYYEQAKAIAEGLGGALMPQGTITFAQLVDQDMVAGYLWNISDDFTSDARFNDGGGVQYAAGTNVYVTTNLKLDCLTGSAVTGVKGSNESTYRKGYVEIDKDDIGLGNVDNTSDADKPVSTAQQTALDGKVAKGGDTMSGNLTIDRQSSGDSFLTLGNNLASSAVNKSSGMIDIYSDNEYRARISTYGQTYSGDRLFVLPNKNGTFAMTSDVDEKVSKSGDTMSGNLYIDNQDGTTSEIGNSFILLGNNKASGTDKNSCGVLHIYGKSSYWVRIYDKDDVLTANRNLSVPDKSGTLATTSDIPTDFVSKADGGTFSGNVTVNRANGTTSSVGTSYLVLGNSTVSGTANNSKGVLWIYGKGSKYATISATDITANRGFELPNKGGTIALTSDIPSTTSSSTTHGTLYKYGNVRVWQSGESAKSITIPNTYTWSSEIASGDRPSYTANIHGCTLDSNGNVTGDISGALGTNGTMTFRTSNGSTGNYYLRMTCMWIVS